MPENLQTSLDLSQPASLRLQRDAWFSNRVAATLAVSAALLSYNLAPLAFGTDALLARVPDDAFYYLVLAKNFVAQGTWTFDGTHPATGFHLLYGYVLAGMYALITDVSLTTAYILVVIVNVTLLAVSLNLLMSAATNAGLENGIIGVVLVALSPASFRIAGYPMECALTVFFGSAAMLLATPKTAARKLAPVFAFATGLFAVLARSDLGALPFALLAGAIAPMVFTRNYDKRTLGVIAVMCAGSLCGEALVMAHTHFFTGGFVQRSASIKLHWAKVSGPTVLPGLARISELMGPHFLPRPLILIAVTGAAAIALLRHGVSQFLNKPLILGCAFTCLGYVAVYALNGAVQYWYAANFFPAVAILSAALWSALAPGRTAAAQIALAVFLASAIYQQTTPPWPWQKGSREAGEFLKAHPEISPVGAWNAGITGYYAERAVINLDGLVNDDVYPYVAENRFTQYLRDRQITYLTDFPSMLEEGAAQRGGYAGGYLAQCVETLRSFAPDARMNGQAYSLMQADTNCLRDAAKN